MQTTWRVARLADHPAARLPLAQMMRALWADYYGDGPSARGDADADLLERSRADGLPMGFVARSADVPVGMATLAATSHGSNVGEVPWIVGLLTVPDWRGQGIASALIAALEDEAAAQGYSQIRCTTDSVIGLLTRRGWRVIRDTDDGEHRVLRLTLPHK